MSFCVKSILRILKACCFLELIFGRSARKRYVSSIVVGPQLVPRWSSVMSFAVFIGFHSDCFAFEAVETETAASELWQDIAKVEGAGPSLLSFWSYDELSFCDLLCIPEVIRSLSRPLGSRSNVRA